MAESIGKMEFSSLLEIAEIHLKIILRKNTYAVMYIIRETIASGRTIANVLSIAAGSHP